MVIRGLFSVLLTIIWSVFPFHGNAQAPDIEWEHSYGGSNWDEPFDIQQTIDSGFIVAGYTQSNDGNVSGYYGGWDYWVIKLTKNGLLEWQKCFGGSGLDVAASIHQTIDGGFILGGESYSNDGEVSGNHGNIDYWIIKINSYGEIQWQKCYGGSNGDACTGIYPDNDGGYLAFGQSGSIDGDITSHYAAEGLSDIWVLKINSFGEIQWEKSYGGTNDDFSGINKGISKTGDGNFIFCGYSFSNDGDLTSNNGESDYWIVKIDTSGNILWQKSFGGSDLDNSFVVTENEIGDRLACAGFAESNDGDVVGSHGEADGWVIQVTNEGLPVLKRCYGGSNAEILIDADYFENTMTFFGSTTSSDGDITDLHGLIDGWTFQIDSNGIIKWQLTLGGSNSDYVNAGVRTFDGGFALAGFSNSTDGDVTGNHGNYDFWIVKLAPPCPQIRFYADADGDGYGNPELYTYSCEDSVGGYVLNNTDCNDSSAGMSPSAIEICNFMDDNCNGIADEDLIYSDFYMDADGDGFGNVTFDSLACLLPAGYVADSTDCDDANALIFPGATEIENGQDDNCNQLIDEGIAIVNNILCGISILPNPVHDILIINISASTGNEIYTLKIINGMGETVIEQALAPALSEINIAHLPAGVYWVDLSSNNVAFEQLIMKIN